eukprot:CAMPEP_0185759326 /NCGR_PEP_ID=MMETSP1174-20130828/18076_1 /TAXON_ID=35687 /ORGANISM="Dictyocha speculum, Strain CCMP1381" /LENGTH=124 /DNA_ID=CAMNT_0028439621 /DNA_START=42 /DNA_END=413 /DNA_ORIENTATION=+
MKLFAFSLSVALFRRPIHHNGHAHRFIGIRMAHFTSTDITQLKIRMKDAAGNIQRNTKMLDLTQLRAEANDLETTSSQEGFWDNAQEAQGTLQQLSRTEGILARVEKWNTQLEDCETAVSILED